MFYATDKVRNARLRYDFFLYIHFGEKWMRQHEQQLSLWFTRHRVGRVHGNLCWCVAHTHMHFAWYYSFKRVIIKLLNYKCWSEHVLQKNGSQIVSLCNFRLNLRVACCQNFFICFYFHFLSSILACGLFAGKYIFQLENKRAAPTIE